ncbi:MAG: hypothetical protein C0524_10435 [Rhodobacter sp.]|nr:hypothetical protein [Rhodobacter sp.]
MAGGTGHPIGTPVTGAREPLMGWSREVGDLRLPLLLTIHALQALPLGGWIASRRLSDSPARATVWLAALAFARALSGPPTF